MWETVTSIRPGVRKRIRKKRSFQLKEETRGDNYYGKGLPSVRSLIKRKKRKTQRSVWGRSSRTSRERKRKGHLANYCKQRARSLKERKKGEAILHSCNNGVRKRKKNGEGRFGRSTKIFINDGEKTVVPYTYRRKKTQQRI